MFRTAMTLVVSLALNGCVTSLVAYRDAAQRFVADIGADDAVNTTKAFTFEVPRGVTKVRLAADGDWGNGPFRLSFGPKDHLVVITSSGESGEEDLEMDATPGPWAAIFTTTGHARYVVGVYFH